MFAGGKSSRATNVAFWIRLLLLGGLAINGLVLLNHFAQTIKLWRRVRSFSNEGARMAMYGPSYRDILHAGEEIPENAVLWWVSPEYPWWVNYFLYPRVMRWGSPNESDRVKFHQDHPADWVIGYAHGYDGGLEIVPPLKSAALPKKAS